MLRKSQTTIPWPLHKMRNVADGRQGKVVGESPRADRVMRVIVSGGHTVLRRVGWGVKRMRQHAGR